MKKKKIELVRLCCVCHKDIGKGNYYSFDGKHLWCVPCGDQKIEQMRLGW